MYVKAAKAAAIRDVRGNESSSRDRGREKRQHERDGIRDDEPLIAGVSGPGPKEYTPDGDG